MGKKLEPLKRLSYYYCYEFTEALIEILNFKNCSLDNYVSSKLVWMVNNLYENNYFSKKEILDANLNESNELTINFNDDSVFTIRKINEDIEFDGIVFENQFCSKNVVDIMIPMRKSYNPKDVSGVTVSVPINVGMNIDNECLRLLRKRAEAGRQLVYSSQVASWNSATKPYK